MTKSTKWLIVTIIFTIAVIGAVFFIVPPAEGLGYLVRVIYFHIPMAWVAVIAFVVSAIEAIHLLRSGDMTSDTISARSARIGFVFVLLATVSGAIFSKLTWGAYWNWDPRQTTIFVLILIYGAYLTLRASIHDERKRARASAVYSLLSCLAMPFLIFILPRLYFSLHPSPIIGGGLMMDSTMVIVLAAAVLDATMIYGWLLIRNNLR